MDNKKKNFAVQTLRRASYRWPGRYNALKEAKIGRNQYICKMCPEGTIHPKKMIQLDHVQPVVDPIAGWQGFDSFIDRLLCETTGYQVLCKPHHEIKTKIENEFRIGNKKKNKKKEKK